MSKRDDYQKHMQEELELWTARIEALASKSSDSLKTQIHKQLEGWRGAGEVAFAKLAELRETSGDHWDVIKKDLEKLWTDLRAIIDKASAEVSGPDAPSAAASSATPAAPTDANPKHA